MGSIVSNILENNETTNSNAFRSRAGIINKVIDAGLCTDKGRFNGRCAIDVGRAGTVSMEVPKEVVDAVVDAVVVR